MARKLQSFSRPKGGTLKKSYNMIIAKRRKGALEIQFNRPDRLNAINEEMAEEIMHAMDAVELDPTELRCTLALAATASSDDHLDHIDLVAPLAAMSDAVAPCSPAICCGAE